MYKNEKQFQIEKKNYRNRGNIDTPNTLYMPTHTFLAWYRHFNKKWGD